MAGVKVLAESSVVLKSVPSKFNFVNEPTASNSDSIPIIDFSLITSAQPDQRSRVIQELGKACQEWGFFIVRRTLTIFIYPNILVHPHYQ